MAGAIRLAILKVVWWLHRASGSYHRRQEIQPSLVQAEASTRFFLSGTGFSSDITLIEFEPVEDGSPGVGFGPLQRSPNTDLAVLSSTSATCTAVLSAAADYSLKLYLADDTTFVPSVTLTAIPADEGPALPVIQGLTDSQGWNLAGKRCSCRDSYPDSRH